jgi:hypothetical protein
LLAVRYQKVAKNVPQILEAKPVEAQSKASKIFFWFMVTLNTVVPILFGLSILRFQGLTLVQQETPSTFLKWLFNTTSFTTGLLQINSGIILVSSVLRIRSFFKKRGAEDYINTKMLLRHGSSFGLYLLTSSAYYGTWVYFTLSQNDADFQVFLMAIVFNNIGSFIAQVLLAMILWDLGTKVKEVVASEYLVSITVEDFDEDA